MQMELHTLLQLKVNVMTVACTQAGQYSNNMHANMLHDTTQSSVLPFGY